MSVTEHKTPTNFIRQIVEKELAVNTHPHGVVTRFPPEPNGFLHIGHAKSICLNFGIAEDFNGRCHLRFDDTNPEKESTEYIEAIQQDVSWLGYRWHGDVRYASHYFQSLYEFAQELIRRDKAYVCELNAAQIREYRGTLTEAGKNSPYRDRPSDESLQLFERMRQGEYEEGQMVLRAKIDMASPNLNMRDPTLYRIRHAHHHQTGDKWCIYPMYDFTHCISDALEGITHSLCTLEFEDHRPLYDWVLDNISIGCHPQQIEFSRLDLAYTVTSKRKLNELVQHKVVDGWDDPRMPTLSGLRRRGFTSYSIRDFCQRIGVTKQENLIEYELLEYCIREDLDKHAPRAMAVLTPIKVSIENYPEDKVEMLTLKKHPQNEEMGQREVPFSREIYIDRSDFEEVPPPKYKRLTLGKEVRLRGAYVIRCDEVVKNEQGDIIELKCTYDADTLGKNPEGRKVKGVIHWVAAATAVTAEVRLYDRLFTEPQPDKAEGEYMDYLNPDSLKVLTDAKVEPSLIQSETGQSFQFEREGYFCVDSDSSVDKLIFNRTVSLRDSWAKQQQKK